MRGVILAVGNGLTVTVALAVAVQPFALVTVTVKVVVEVGEPVMAAVVAPVDQLYDVPPLAVKVVGVPSQMVAEAGVILAVGVGLTVTVVLVVAVQPFASVTVTVKVVVELGEPVMAAVVAPVDQL